MRRLVCLVAFLAACPSGRSEQRSEQRPDQPLTPRANEDGLTEDTAITVPFVRAEYQWLRAHPCPGGGAWKVHKQALVGGERPCFIDRLDAVCDSSGEERSFYFRGWEKLPF